MYIYISCGAGGMAEPLTPGRGVKEPSSERCIVCSTHGPGLAEAGTLWSNFGQVTIPYREVRPEVRMPRSASHQMPRKCPCPLACVRFPLPLPRFYGGARRSSPECAISIGCPFIFM